MSESSQTTSDFRYNTKNGVVPWATVGEQVIANDILDILRFLLPPASGDQATYDGRFKELEASLFNLTGVARYCSKLTLGSKVKALEAEAAKYLGCQHAVFLTNATAGFEIAQQFVGIRPGDEVIVPAITFIATMLYPLHIGAKVVIADVDPLTLNMDPADVARKITPKTRMIIPVHLGGYPVEMDAIMALASKHNITVLEDAAHGFGGSYHGKSLGTIGDFGAYSFHEVKNCTSLGEGGILVTNDSCGVDFARARFAGFDMAHPIEKWLYDITAIKNRTGDWSVPGNHSVTEIQAVALLSQMKRIDSIIAKRRRAAERLTAHLEKVPGVICQPRESQSIRSSHHLYLLQVDPGALKGDIQEFKARLETEGVTQIAHFAPLYRFSILKQLGYDTAAIAATCPVAERAFLNTFTHLPLYQFSDAQVDFMAEAVKKVIIGMKK